MQELFRHLTPTARVLDLGAARGSFKRQSCPGRVVRVDIDQPGAAADGCFVRADAAALPFPDGSFALVICNHSLEHFARLEAALGEVRRVLTADGTLYVAVPDASTITDRIYRWLARGGGHVNAFRSLGEVTSIVERHSGLALRSARVLCTSLSFLNRRNLTSVAPRKLVLLGGGREPVLRWLAWLFRLSDRFLRTRASVYGWVFTFGRASDDVPRPCDAPWTNVCVRCGGGHPSRMLARRGLIAGRWPRRFACPDCGAVNHYTDDRKYLRLR